ncbi:amino acid-binding domain sensor hybrid histidine kinase [Desulfatibacillum alkenivorans DSM 16219]|jgi:signal transduction histidine kinase/CheY-like chemotaxis protein/ABC-type amino acid transport substrate-binding protein|uniref:histidine kinase n=1 Tax=Desulfatibacillum alkenivorans DSM 16219 TaxID=1121393 RepID=A0A1M6WYJ3_9BACT|nr:transporter substrate-binding domain-containing protein [Desulfatibacillum alkenivorans]SHK98820.1 amino acid-binding domain sensor hybrid histidine kinase [Desulfatibacillum alkenivorans DSM 16219]
MRHAFRWQFTIFFIGIILLYIFGVCLFSNAGYADVDQPAYPEGLSFTQAEKDWLAQHRKIRVAGPRNFPPFYFYEDGPAPKGVAADIMRAVAGTLGLEVEVIPDIPWPRVLEMAKNREVDWIPCAAVSEPRKAFWSFTDPFMSFPLLIITTSDTGFIGGIHDLNGKKLSGVKDIAWRDWLAKDGIAYEWIPAATPLDSLRMVSEGKADATIENLATSVYNIDRYGLSNLKAAAPTAYEAYNLHFAVRNDWPELQSILNKALHALPTEQKNEIKGKWLSLRYEHGIRLQDVLIWGAGAGASLFLIMGLILAWNRRLGREIALREATERDLHTSLSILHETLEQAPMAIEILKKADGRIQLIIENQESQKIKDVLCREGGDDGFALEDCFELEFRDIASSEPISFSMLPAQRAFAGETVENERIMAIGRDRRQVPLEVSAAPVYGNKGEIEAVFSAFSDISLRLQLEEDQRQSQKMEAIGTLAGGIAHDFNNILSIMIGNAELAAADAPAWSPTYAKLIEIKSAGMRARNLVRRLLSFSRNTPLSKRPVLLSSIVSESVGLLQATLAANIEIRCTGLENKGIILADATQLHQVLINLCTNAAHAMEEGGGILDISVKSVELNDDDAARSLNLEAGSYIRLEVADTGIGMSKETADRIFDPYFTTKELGKGTGLGLSVVHGIVRSCSGAIEVDTAPNQGTRISILFPASDQAVPEPEPAPALPEGGTERVLMVDDEPQIIEMNTLMLEKFGYQVTSFTDSREAFKRFLESPGDFDLIITDMAMPNLSGDILAQKARTVRPDIPIIICTGFSEKIKKLRELDLGAVTYLRKPISMNELAAEVKKSLQKAA